MKSRRWSAALLALTLAAPGCLPTADKWTGSYEIEMVRMNPSVWGAIRYDRESGRAWQAIGGKWIPIVDSDAPPLSTYAVRMIGLEEDWGAIRFDVHSGRTWQAVENRWVEIAE